MKVLIIADEESKALWDHFTPDKLKGIDLIVSCGDLKAEYLEFLVTMSTVPLLYVPGNHDTAYQQHPPEGCENIDGKVFKYKGVRFFGLGGSMKYGREPYMYTEKEMRRRLWQYKPTIFNSSGFDVLVTHSPARGYGDMDDFPHRGFECYNELLERCRPKYLLHGHVHATYGTRFRRVLQHPSGAKIINGYERYILDIDENDLAAMTRREITTRLITAFL
ncbi:metallophosphoesterase family protein [Ruminococcus albus]|uniref:Predicted phosphoesterase n=1 Tax=Ruminococcus albus TaxID=1264 RepID=A0A1I1M0R5_RUMAL|nr:metallophosphoesterase [Ruminococcus albus]SFC76798.1 Predicted phosphoesterase [Ruminococcus albus]